MAMEEETAASTTATPAGSHHGRLDEEDSRETGVLLVDGPVDTPSTTSPNRETPSTTSDDDDDEQHPRNEQQQQNNQSTEEDCDNSEDDDENDDMAEEEEEDDLLSPEDLLLKAVASSAVRFNDSSTRQQQQQQLPKDATGVRVNGSNQQPSNAHDKDQDDVHRHRDSTSSSWVPPPTSWPTRDRHVALPGAFAAPGQQALATISTTRSTPAAGAVANSNDDSYEEEEENGMARTGAGGRGKPPTLEATLVEDHSEATAAAQQQSRSAEVVQAELLESQEFTPARSSQDKAARRPKRILVYVLLGVLVLALVIGITVWVTIVTVDSTKQNSSSTQDDPDDDETNESDDRGGKGFDPSSEWRERGYDSITHHVAYVGWQTPRRCNAAVDEPAVHVECGGGGNDNNRDERMDAEIKVWQQFSMVFEDKPCFSVNPDPPFRELACASLDYYDNSTTAATTTTHLARVVFSCGARRNSSHRLARVFVPKLEGYCGEEENETDTVKITVALALQRICPVGDEYSGNATVAPSLSSSTQCLGNATDTFPVSLVNVDDGVACRHQSEPCRADDEEDALCMFDALEYLAVEEWNKNSTDHDNNEEEDDDHSSCPSRLLQPNATIGGLASLSQLYEQFFGNSSNIGNS